jgi:hypothetical protein
MSYGGALATHRHLKRAAAPSSGALVARTTDAEAALPNGPPETMRPQRRLLSHRRVSAADLHRMRVRQRRKWRTLCGPARSQNDDATRMRKEWRREKDSNPRYGFRAL